MKPKNAQTLPSEITVVLSAPVGEPFAARVPMRRLLTWAFTGGTVLVMLFLGTLLFFRELEINRELLAKLLELRATEKLATQAPPPRNLTSTKGDDEEAAMADGEAAEDDSGATVDLNTRITDLAIDCTKRACNAKLSLATTHPGYARGFLAMVLETELPRIGSGNASANVRKRFFFYPPSEARDELGPNDLARVEQNGYRFARVLQTQATFTIPELLRPVAVNAYIFDANHNLVLHERRPIEPEEG